MFNQIIHSVPYRTWGAVAGWLASRTIDPRVVSSNPGRSVTCGCVPGQNTLPLIARVFSNRTLKIVGPFYLVSMPGEVKDPTRVINNVTRSGLTNSSISGAIGYGRVVRTTDCGRRCAQLAHSQWHQILKSWSTAVGGAAWHKHGRAPFAILRRRMSNDKPA